MKTFVPVIGRELSVLMEGDLGLPVLLPCCYF